MLRRCCERESAVIVNGQREEKGVSREHEHEHEAEAEAVRASSKVQPNVRISDGRDSTRHPLLQCCSA